MIKMYDILIWNKPNFLFFAFEFPEQNVEVGTVSLIHLYAWVIEGILEWFVEWMNVQMNEAELSC